MITGTYRLICQINWIILKAKTLAGVFPQTGDVILNMIPLMVSWSGERWKQSVRKVSERESGYEEEASSLNPQTGAVTPSTSGGATCILWDIYGRPALFTMATWMQ